MLELGIVRFPAVHVRNTAVIMVQTNLNIGLGGDLNLPTSNDEVCCL